MQTDPIKSTPSSKNSFHVLFDGIIDTMKFPNIVPSWIFEKITSGNNQVLQVDSPSKATDSKISTIQNQPILTDLPKSEDYLPTPKTLKEVMDRYQVSEELIGQLDGKIQDYFLKNPEVLEVLIHNHISLYWLQVINPETLLHGLDASLKYKTIDQFGEYSIFEIEYILKNPEDLESVIKHIPDEMLQKLIAFEFMDILHYAKALEELVTNHYLSDEQLKDIYPGKLLAILKNSDVFKLVTKHISPNKFINLSFFDVKAVLKKTEALEKASKYISDEKFNTMFNRDLYDILQNIEVLEGLVTGSCLSDQQVKEMDPRNLAAIVKNPDGLRVISKYLPIDQLIIMKLWELRAILKNAQVFEEFVLKNGLSDEQIKAMGTKKVVALCQNCEALLRVMQYITVEDLCNLSQEQLVAIFENSESFERAFRECNMTSLVLLSMTPEAIKSYLTSPEMERSFILI